MTTASLALWVTVLAPAAAAFPGMLRDGLAPLLAVGVSGLLTVLWLGAVLVILAVTRESAVPGVFWTALAAAVVVVEIIRLPPARPSHEDDPGFRR